MRGGLHPQLFIPILQYMQQKARGDVNLRRKLIPVCVCVAMVLSSVGMLAGETVPPNEGAEEHALGGLWSPEGPRESATTHIVRPEEIFAAHPGPLPSYVDNSAGLPPVGNQQSQGSCTCWAIGYYHATYIENHESAFDLEDPNNQASPAFLYNVANGGYNGGSYMEDVADLIISNGVPSMSEVPYDQYDYTSWPAHDWIWVSGMKRNAVSQNWLDLTQTTGMGALKAYLAAGNTATIGIEVWSNFDYIEDFRNTYCSSERYGTDRGGHIVTICGYDDAMPTADGSGALRMVNSWGTGWGEAGYWWMSYGAVQDSLICYGWSMYLESELNYEPKVVAKVQIDHDARGDITRNFGLGVTVYEDSAEIMSKSFLCCYWIDDWYGSGSQQHPFPDGKMAFDISEVLSGMDPALEHSFVLSMTNSGGLAGGLISYEILNAEYWEGDISWETPLFIEPYDQTLTEASVFPGWFVHLPIRINSDLDMEQQAIGEFWQGAGTESNPYIIPEYYIWGENRGNCIFIGNTTSGFVIDNCTVEGASGGDWSDYLLDTGIYLYSVSGGAVNGNNASGNVLGIYAEGCFGSLVEGNNVDSNVYGIVFSGCSYMVMRMNDVAGSAGYGVYLEMSSDVLVYHNNFLDNPVQAGDDAGLNEWDNGYPSGGNYWSDYSGPDMMSGPFQDQPGSDRIGDIPYTNIDSGMGAQDGYPLMEPWVPEPGMTHRNPIRINSNADFDEARGVVNWDTGNGSEANPWIIDGWEIDGTRRGCCIYIGNTTDSFIVKNCSLYGASGFPSNAFYRDTGLYLYNAQNGIAVNNTMHSNRMGIFVSYSDENSMIGNANTNNDFSISLSHSNFNHLMHNVDLDNLNSINLGYSNQNVVFNNTCIGNGDGVYLANSADNIIEQNYVSDSYLYNGISLDTNCVNNTIINNTCKYSHYNGIGLWSSEWNTVANNSCEMNGYNGLALTSSNHNILWRNNCTESVNYQGIYLGNSNWNQFTENTCNENNNNGLYMFNSHNNTLNGNNFSDNVNFHGISMESSNGNAINGCTLSSNCLFGIGLWSSQMNTINENYIGYNGNTGIYLYASMDNMIYHNAIEYNLFQASDNSINSWDNGYPSAGNYWSDYTGIDLYSGPNQDIPGSDGIGDTPYIFDYNQDNYPLMEPWALPVIPSFCMDLTSGWNLISIPLEMAGSSVEDVLSSISGSWSVVKYYDSSDTADPWKTFRVGSQSNDLSDIDGTMGVWVHATGNCTLTVSGQEPTSSSITLIAGWNLVGYPSITERVMSDALWGTSADRVEVFDPADPELLRVMGPGEYMVPGQGYWIHVIADTVWTVDW